MKHENFLHFLNSFLILEFYTSDFLSFKNLETKCTHFPRSHHIALPRVRVIISDPKDFCVLLCADLLTGGVQHEVGGQGEDDGEDDGGQGEGEAGGARVEADGDQRVQHRDVALHRQRDGQVHRQHQARLDTGMSHGCVTWLTIH